MKTTTIHIQMTDKMHQQAKKLVAKGNYHSISELIRAGIRRVIYDANVITENGLHGWEEDQILEAADQPIKKSDEVWETPEDVERYFRKLRKKLEKKRQKTHAKNHPNWQVQSVAR